jgi:murein DD-endopeptidase MepM/ murein hydrolase activator NlpD
VSLLKRRTEGVTVVLVPGGGGDSLSFRLSSMALRVTLAAAALGLAAVIVVVATWWHLASEVGRSRDLQALVDSLQDERLQIVVLAEELGRVEAEYDSLRALFGTSSSPSLPDIWLPQAGVPGSGIAGRRPSADDYLPRSWPLTEPGFVTQSLTEGEAGDHTGLDIAIPTHSYVRASGAGRVLRIGEDPVYGWFLVLEHGEGYQTVYAHASSILVERGQAVRRNEVIALTGSSGRSTAPHLHFEILLNGLPVNPLSMIQPPA